MAKQVGEVYVRLKNPRTSFNDPSQGVNVVADRIGIFKLTEPVNNAITDGTLIKCTQDEYDAWVDKTTIKKKAKVKAEEVVDDTTEEVETTTTAKQEAPVKTGKKPKPVVDEDE